MKIKLCDRCDWPLLHDDYYCSGCGKIITFIEATLEDEENYSARGEYIKLSRYEDDRKPIRITFINTGPHKRTLSTANNESISIEPKVFELLPGDAHRKTVELNFTNQHNLLPDCIEWHTDQGYSAIQLSVNWKPFPTISCKEKEVILESNSNKLPLTASLSGSDITVKKIMIDPPWVQIDQIPRFWKKNTDVKFSLLVDSVNMDENNFETSEILISFFINERVKPIEVRVPIRWAGMKTFDLIAAKNEIVVEVGEKANFKFKLRPRQKEQTNPIVFEHLQITVLNDEYGDLPQEKQQERILEFKWLSKNAYGDSIDSKGDNTYEIEIDTSNLSEAIYTLSFQFDTNQSSPVSSDLVLRVEPQKEFNGILTMDFGTSYSMCTYRHKGDETKSLIIDDSEAILSKILYKTFEEKYIGNAAVNLTYTDRNVNWSQLFDSVKRFIGSDTRYHLAIDGKYKELTPIEVMLDYCREMLSIFEKQVGKFKGTLTLTYPSKFSWLQGEQIRWVAQNLGIPAKDSHFLDEGRAIAHYVRNIANYKIEAGSTFMVMDIGGGTTDIAICKQTDDPYPEIISIAGDRYFGGEHITEWIADAIIDQIELMVAPKKVLYGDNFPEAIRLDPVKSSHTSETRYEILNKAFEIKKEWPKSDFSMASVYTYDTSTYEVHSEKNIEIEFKEKDFKKIEEKTKEKIRSILDEVNEILKEENLVLSLIILAGQGSLFSPIKQMISDIMATEIIQCDELKGAVSKGAIAYTRFAQTYGVRIHIPHLTRSALGIMLPEKGTSDLIFEEFIPRNSTIPTITNGRWISWNGSLNKIFEIWEQWGPKSYRGQLDYQDYIGTDEIEIASELEKILDLSDCYLLLRLLENETLSLCKFFRIRQEEIDLLTLLHPDIKKMDKNGTTIYSEEDFDIDLFSNDVLFDLEGQVVFLKERLFEHRGGLR